MRRGRDGEIWRDDEGKMIAINLGSDYCAEHEWGIKGIRSKLKIPEKADVDLGRSAFDFIKNFFGLKQPVGLETRTMRSGLELVTNLGEKPVSYTSTDYKTKKKTTFKFWGITTYKPWSGSVDWKGYVGWYDPERESFISQWDEGDFMILSEDKDLIQELYDVFVKGDISVWIGGSGPFKNGGLTLAIASRLPQDFRDEMLSVDRDQLEIKKAAFETGIHNKLKEAGKNYFALSPRWKDENKKEVVFWLNPHDQQNNNFGWYSAKELEEWIEGNGPIPKNKEE
jgi:hypothetical protein